MGHVQAGKSAFAWDVYKNRKTALQYLRRNQTLVDTILETEDGSAFEMVHSQVISAFGDKLNDYIRNNGVYLEDNNLASRQATACSDADLESGQQESENQSLGAHLSANPNPNSSSSQNQSQGETDSQSPNPNQEANLAKVLPATQGRPRARGNQSQSHRAEGAAQVLQRKYQQHLMIKDRWQAERTATCCSNLSWPRKLKLVRLKLVNKYVLGILVECAYSGYIRTDLGSGGIWQVLEVADHYEMSEVIRACCSFLMKNLDRSNCVHFYHIGMKHRHILQRSAWHKIRANFKHILAQNLGFAPLTGAGRAAEGQTVNQNANQSRCQSQSENQNNNQEGKSCRSQNRNGDGNQSQNQNQSNQKQREFENQNERRLSESNAIELAEQKRNNLATIKFEHFKTLLYHDKLNIDNEESIWLAIKLWCNYQPKERAAKVSKLLPCMRFPRFRSGTDFSAQNIWRDPLILANHDAQQVLAILDRNHRDLLTGLGKRFLRDGFKLPCAVSPQEVRPRIPHSVLLAVGGWQQGQPSKIIESYDLNCNLWFESPKRMMTALAYHGLEYIKGLLYICGGTDGSEILNELFTLNPVSGECKQKASMREVRCYVATAQLGAHLYAMGGHNGNQRMRSVERFELEEENWGVCRDMNVARSDASACVHKSRIFIAGGLNDALIESSVEFYNPQDDSWTFVRSMQVPRTSFALVAFAGSLLAIGGNNGTERLASVERLDEDSGQWRSHSEMRHRRSTFSAAVVEDSKLLVVGGYNGHTPFSQVEMFDLERATWTPVERMRYDRSGLKVVVLSDLPNAIEYTFLGSQGFGVGVGVGHRGIPD